MTNIFKIGSALVMAILCGCEDILEVPDISDQTVTVFAPLDNTVISGNDISFDWDRVTDATAYRFQLATPNFENTQQLVLDSIFEVDSLGRVGTRIQRTLVNGDYAWRIKAMNSDYETVYTLNGFQVDGDDNLDTDPPNTPQLVAPANGASQSGATVNFSWTREDVEGTAERDSIFIYSDQTLQAPVAKALGSDKAHTADFSAGTFYWTVRAYDGAGNKSDVSSTFNFTVNN